MFSIPFPLHTPCMPVTLKLRYTISMISGAKASVKLSLPELAIFWCNTGLAVFFFSVWSKDDFIFTGYSLFALPLRF